MLYYAFSFKYTLLGFTFTPYRSVSLAAGCFFAHSTTFLQFRLAHIMPRTVYPVCVVCTYCDRYIRKDTYGRISHLQWRCSLSGHTWYQQTTKGVASYLSQQPLRIRNKTISVDHKLTSGFRLSRRLTYIESQPTFTTNNFAFTFNAITHFPRILRSTYTGISSFYAWARKIHSIRSTWMSGNEVMQREPELSPKSEWMFSFSISVRAFTYMISDSHHSLPGSKRTVNVSFPLISIYINSRCMV